MNASQNQIERRKFFDPSPRATYAQCTVRDNTDLVRAGSENHTKLLRFGFIEIDRDGDNALMLPPAGWSS